MPEHVPSKFSPNPAVTPDSEMSATEDGTKSGRLVPSSFDGEYVQRLTNGDPEAERHFTDYFGQRLLIKLRTRLHCVQTMEDIRQETFLRVLTALRLRRSLESPERLEAFVNSVCNNLLFEFYRVQSRTQLAVPDAFESGDEGVSAESALLREERKQHVRQVLDDLPGKDRALLYMIFYEDAKRAEICRRFRVDQQYLRVLLHRAKGRFKKCFLQRHKGMSRLYPIRAAIG